MGINKVDLYLCDVCEYSNIDHRMFRLFEGRVLIGEEVIFDSEICGGTQDSKSVICLDCLSKILKFGIFNDQIEGM